MKTLISTLLIGLIVLSSCGSANVKEPEYRDIREVKLIELGLLQSTAGIDLIYYNPNNFGVQVAEARGDVYIDNIYFGRFGLGEKVQVKKRSEFIVPAIIKLDMIGAVKNQRELLKKKEVLVRIEGMARIKKSGLSRDVPIKFESMQNIERFRSLIAQ
ncbi:MAG TPA: LEA type 2 family protein [Chitinophagaceae bacterium]|nr:LEA type 2 family protein [Chitinophagaceae bacterium]